MKKITNECNVCKACVYSCPKKAISIKNDLYEEIKINDEICIKCGLCNKLCPNNQKKEKNNPVFKVARVKNNKNINKSTSGGIFGELARYFIKHDGVVYGAAFTNDFYSTKHIRCTTLKEINKILKSKYMRSDINNTYLLVKKDLNNKRLVLFSGTPCQVAGLKSYLRKDYENLITIDIICHGTPPSNIWSKYLKELEQKEESKAILVDFRYFNEKDPSKNFLIKFENNKEYNDSLYNNPYGKAFLTGLINYQSCNDCKFKNFNNYSDITIGDAWAYKNKKYPHKNSLVLINTEKGQEIYNKIKNKLIEFSDFNIEELLKNNYPILYPTESHYNNKNFKIEKNKSITNQLNFYQKEINGLKKDKKGVGIINFHYENYNYGTNLVAYSLSKVVESINYNPYIIDFDPFKELDAIERYRTIEFLNFRNKYLKMTPKFKTKEELDVLNKYLDMYITGSDQVFRKQITGKNLETYFLDFAKGKNKISYAASFGTDDFEGTEEETEDCKNLLNTFYNISVREIEGQKILKNKFNQASELVLDPTLLLTAKDYEKIITEEYNEKIDVAVYFVMDSENKILNDENFKRLFPNKNIVNVKGHFEEISTLKVFKYNSISLWLDGIRKCEYLVTDSYHGVIFGIIFHKKIICIGKKSKCLSRFNTLFTNLKGNLEEINYSSLNNVQSINININYEEIDNNINRLKEKSIKFLKDNLNPNNTKNTLDFENLLYKNRLLKNEIKELTTKYEEVLEEKNKILNSKSWQITSVLRKLKHMIRRWKDE